MARKRSESLTRAVMYIRRKLRNKNWKLGERVDTISAISDAAGVSCPTAKKALTLMCNDGVLESRDRYGYFVVGNLTVQLRTGLNVLSDIKKIQMSLKATKLLANGAIYDGKTVTIMKKDQDFLTLFFPITGIEEKFELNIVRGAMFKPLSVEDVINDNKLKLAFDKQSKVKEYFNIIIPNRKKLGLRRS